MARFIFIDLMMIMICSQSRVESDGRLRPGRRRRRRGLVCSTAIALAMLLCISSNNNNIWPGCSLVSASYNLTPTAFPPTATNGKQGGGSSGGVGAALNNVNAIDTPAIIISQYGPPPPPPPPSQERYYYQEQGGVEKEDKRRFAVTALTKRFASSLLQRASDMFGVRLEGLDVINSNSNNKSNVSLGYDGEEDYDGGDWNFDGDSIEEQEKIGDDKATGFETCLRHFKNVFAMAELNEHVWARKLLDSWGKPPSGIYAGSLSWFGDFDECLQNKPPPVMMTHTDPNDLFEPRFCKLGFTTSTQPDKIMPQPQIIQFPLALTIGICVPDSCDATSLIQLVELFALPKARTKFPILNAVRLVPSLSQCQLTQIPIDWKAAFAIGLFSVWGFFILVATIFDITVRIIESRRRQQINKVTVDGGVEMAVETRPSSHRHRSNHQQHATTCFNSEAALNVGDESGIIMMAPMVESPELITPVDDEEEEPTPTANQTTTTPPLPPPPSSPSSLSISASNTSLSRFTTLFRFVFCFSLYTNFTKLIATKTPLTSTGGGENLKALNGLRVLSLFWIILAHCFFFMQIAFDNLQTVFDMRKSFGHQFVLGSVLGVDTFFFLSGFLAYWTLAKTLNLYSDPKSRSRFLQSLPVIYFNRYLRLTPPYMAVLAVSTCLWPYLSNGPYYFQQTDEYCTENWWTNLLYVNNVVRSTRMCIGWSWYLAVDMQLSLLAPFVVFLFQRWSKVGLYLLLGLLLGQALVAAVLTYIFHLPSTLLPDMQNIQAYGNVSFLSESFPSSADYFWELTPESNFAYYFDMIYIKPLCWIAPYLIGLTVGYLVAKRAVSLRRCLSIKLSLLLWFCALATIFGLVYGQWGQYSQAYVTPPIGHAIYNAFSRTLWAMAIGWIVVACVFNRAGPICRILAWSGWVVPAKLAYTAYLIHPLLLIFYMQTSRRPFHATDTVMLWFFLGTIFVTYLGAVIFSLLFESPILAMQRLYIRPRFQRIGNNNNNNK